MHWVQHEEHYEMYFVADADWWDFADSEPQEEACDDAQSQPRI